MGHFVAPVTVTVGYSDTFADSWGCHCNRRPLYRAEMSWGHCLELQWRSGFLNHAKNQNCDNDKKSDLKIRSDFWGEYVRVVLTDHCWGEVALLCLTLLPIHTRPANRHFSCTPGREDRSPQCVVVMSPNPFFGIRIHPKSFTKMTESLAFPDPKLKKKDLVRILDKS